MRVLLSTASSIPYIMSAATEGTARLLLHPICTMCHSQYRERLDGPQAVAHTLVAFGFIIVASRALKGGWQAPSKCRPRVTFSLQRGSQLQPLGSRMRTAV
jgi:hypothetical protein